jgi:hypothetical protein
VVDAIKQQYVFTLHLELQSLAFSLSRIELEKLTRHYDNKQLRNYPYCHLYVSFVDWKVNLRVISKFGAFCKNEKNC